MPNASLASPSDDSTRSGACQSAAVGNAGYTTPPDPVAAVIDYRLVRRYGASVLARGYTACPNLLFQHYAALGISEPELVFLLQIWTFWWDASSPHPSLPTIAGRMGKSVRQLQTYVERLRERGFLRVAQRYDGQGRQLSNSYDLGPLVHMLGALSGSAPTTRTAEAAPVRVTVGLRAPDVNLENTCEGTDGGDNVSGQRQVDPYSSAVPVKPASSLRMTVAAPPTLRFLSPHEYSKQPDTDQNTDLVSSPPTGPITQSDGDGTREETCQDADLLEVVNRRLPAISKQLGDTAPASSISRAARIFSQATMSPAAGASLLAESQRTALRSLPQIRGRDRAGRRNAMPYFLAVLERSVRDEHVDQGARSGSKADEAPCKRHGCDPIPEDADPMWRVVLEEIRSVVVPDIFNHRLLPAQVHWADENTLVVESVSQWDAQWLDRTMRRHVERALCATEHGHVSVTFTCANPM